MTPQQILNEYSRMYPEAWDNYDLLIHALNPNRKSWPDWLFAPIAAAYAVVSGGGSNRVPLERIPHVAQAAKLGETLFGLPSTSLDAVLAHELGHVWGWQQGEGNTDATAVAWENAVRAPGPPRRGHDP